MNRRWNSEISSLDSLEDVLRVCDRHAAEFNETNAVTALHRAARSCASPPSDLDPRLRLYLGHATELVLRGGRPIRGRLLGNIVWASARLMSFGGLAAGTSVAPGRGTTSGLAPQTPSITGRRLGVVSFPGISMISCITTALRCRVAHSLPQNLSNGERRSMSLLPLSERVSSSVDEARR